MKNTKEVKLLESEEKNKVRAWLKGNKIFFDTITATFLSFMAIIVAICSAYLTFQQVNLLHSESLPQFKIYHNYTDYDTTDKAYHTRQLEIYNYGKPVDNFSFDTAVFVSVDPSDKYTFKNGRIPLTGYYYRNQPVVPSSNSNLIAFADYPNNNNKFSNVYKQLLSEKIYLKLDEYIKLMYKDKLGVTHDDYYRSEVVEAVKIPNQQGQQIFKEYENYQILSSMLDIDNLSLEIGTQSIAGVFKHFFQ